jgi:hypothetical protein
MHPLHRAGTCGIPAYGSHLGYLTASGNQWLAVCGPTPVTRVHDAVMLCSARALLARISLGPRPWLPSFVHGLRSYYDGD